jgi:hypothetical protein
MRNRDKRHDDKANIVIHNHVTVNNNCDSIEDRTKFYGHTNNGAEVRTIASVVSHSGKVCETRLDPTQSKEQHYDQARECSRNCQ